MARPPDPFDKVRFIMLEEDAKGGRIYPCRRPPDPANAHAATTGNQGSSPGPTTTSTDAQDPQPQPHETILAAAKETPPSSIRANDRSTPFRQRDYVDPTSTVRGKYGADHTRIRQDKWHEMSVKYRGDPVGYKKAKKKLRYRDNKDKRMQAEKQLVAAAAVPSETTQTQKAWAAEETEDLE